MKFNQVKEDRKTNTCQMVNAYIYIKHKGIET